jgi:hypothetical protein
MNKALVKPDSSVPAELDPTQTVELLFDQLAAVAGGGGPNQYPVGPTP